MEQKKYSIIYADPPWRYEMKKGQGVAENHYSTMGTEENLREKLCIIFVGDISTVTGGVPGHKGMGISL